MTPSDPLKPRLLVSDFLEICNQTLDYAFSNIEIEGEISNFKISKDKWVFFDLKDNESTLNCFSTVFNLRTPLADGMRVVVSGSPRLTKAGRFSFTISKVQPLGEGNIKKAFELLKEKLSKEGLFDPTKKRPLPESPTNLAVISSTGAAGYADFVKILNERWGGLNLTVANCNVQGLSAADEIVRAIDYFNEESKNDVIIIIRGGGSPDDLAVFNDEFLARKIASSKIPVLTGIGHEIDESIADLAADVRASTPSNAAELLTKDKKSEISRLHDNFSSLEKYISHYLDTIISSNKTLLSDTNSIILQKIQTTSNEISHKIELLNSLNPEQVLKQGYSILSGKISPGNVIKITTINKLITAEVKHVEPK
ncbi:exodeoxyribonuclease VII large subunit [Candidatus Saccharibacteria bacterium]|nr:exodeoxyribonuclease VII large subunit [Candidatus Saccharibacteria bacterium]